MVTTAETALRLLGGKAPGEACMSSGCPAVYKLLEKYGSRHP